MVIDAYRIVREKELVALAWIESDKIILKNNNEDEREILKNTNETGFQVWLKNYCSENDLKNIGKISLPKEDMDLFLKTVNEKNPIRKTRIKIN